MVATILDRDVLPESLSSYFVVPRIAVSPRDGGVFLTAATDAEPLREPTIDEIFRDLQYDFGDDYKFNRDEANDYE